MLHSKGVDAIIRNRIGLALACVLLASDINIALSEPISRNNMAAYCRGEVSGMYGTKPRYVATGQIEQDDEGNLSINGTVDKGNEGIKKFMCRFDKEQNFIDVMAMTSDGNL